MCPGPKPLPITITVTATTATPFPPGLSDGLLSVPIGGANDADFTTEVVPGQEVHFVVGGDISEITAITETVGDFFSVNPTQKNGWVGTVGPNRPNKTGSDYTVCYNVNGAPNNPYCQDPKLRMKA
jgi:hypothetical protein